MTARGRAVAVCSITLLVAAALLHYTGLGVLAAGGLCAVVLGLAWVRRPSTLAVERHIEPRRVARGDTALGLISIRNTRRISTPAVVAVEPCGQHRLAIDVPRLSPGASFRTSYRLPTDRRGAFDVGPLEIGRQDPLGLWRIAARRGNQERLLVRPRTHPLRGMPAGRTRSLDGPESDMLPSGSITFHALREYVRGDDLRRVHWRSSARLGTLMVREHVDTSVPDVTVVLDTASSSYADDEFEEAVETAASVARAAVDAGYPVRLTTAQGGASVSARTESGAILDALALVQAGGDLSLRGVLAQFHARRSGDVMVVVTGTPSRQDLDAAGAACGRFDRGVLAMVSKRAAHTDVAVGPGVSVVRGANAPDLAIAWNARVRR